MSVNHMVYVFCVNINRQKNVALLVRNSIKNGENYTITIRTLPKQFHVQVRRTEIIKQIYILFVNMSLFQYNLHLNVINFLQ